jgi:hypothetical protein
MRPFAEYPARWGKALLFKNQQPIGVGASVGWPDWGCFASRLKSLGCEGTLIGSERKQEVLAR